MLSGVAWQSFWWIVAFHAALVPMGIAAQSIAGEKDRRTLDFLLGTPLSSAEIVLGKLAACFVQFAMYVAAGVPVMVLLRVLGGIDIWLIFLAYAGVVLPGGVPDRDGDLDLDRRTDARRAVSYSVLLFMVWLTVPMLASLLVPRFFPGVPRFIMTANAWVLASSPIGLVFRIAGGTTRAGLMRRGDANERSSTGRRSGVCRVVNRTPAP